VQFKLGSTIHEIPIDVYPSRRRLNVVLNSGNNYTIGGEIYKLPNLNTYTIGRLIKGMTPSSRILVKCIDDSANNKISLKYVDEKDIYYDITANKSARTYATLTITPQITEDRQRWLVSEFNTFLNKHRSVYHSLFLSNYRESKPSKDDDAEFARKRISFDLVYKIVAYLLELSDGHCVE
jgi:hypothetical protein